ncbi:uncharacterized protein FTOL_03109 [Fusarium torulosum]|uniref:F-box domain-containing protein n=1 Tax=Fusarium torulosum TaxID=33205 RepID=A0AAE8SFF1_9HYPO|nr:uncharacterized protein FTOL_03109 [Fusarium torulosum]
MSQRQNYVEASVPRISFHNRQAEWWTFVTPEKRQKMRLLSPVDDGDVSGPAWFCTDRLSFNAFKLLCNSPEKVKIKADGDFGLGLSRMPSLRVEVLTSLEGLPAELLMAIFMLLEPGDLIALGLCSQTLWNHAVTYAQGGYFQWKSAYSWVNTPLMCAGSKLNALPKSVYDNGAAAILGELPPWDGPDTEEQTGLNDWYHRVIELYQEMPCPYDGLYSKAFSEQIRSSGIPENLHGSMKASLPIFNVEIGSKWYLCNLSQKEYICMEGVVARKGEATVCLKKTHWLTLDILLLWLITWRGEEDTQDVWSWEELGTFAGFPDGSLEDTLMDQTYGPLNGKFWPMWAGAWAGQRLEVVAERKLDVDWANRTGEIDSLADKMMRLFYGLSIAEGSHWSRKYWAKVFKESGGVIWLHITDHSSGTEKVNVVKYDYTEDDPW